MEPIKQEWKIYDRSTAVKRFEVRTGYVDEQNPGAPVDLRPYLIKMQGRISPTSASTFFDLEKPAGETGSSGLYVTGEDNNELVIELSSEMTESFRGRNIISDLQLSLDSTIKYWIRYYIINTAGVTR